MSARPCLSLLSALLLSACAHGGPALTVSAGKVDRVGSVVTFSVPGEIPGALRTPQGEVLPVQKLGDGKAVFILPRLAAGETVSLTPAATPAVAAVTATRKGGKVALRDAAGPILEFQAEAGPLPRPEIRPVFARGGYLHPVFSPSGRVLTDDFPKDHLHHHGVWMAWTKTNFQGRATDFWNMGEGKARVEFASLAGEPEGGPVFARVQSLLRHVDLTGGEPRAVLNETWDVRSWRIENSGKPVRVFDLESVQTCATEEPLKLPVYHYGGLGFRGRGEWNGAGNLMALNSEGVTDRAKINTGRSRWCYVGGLVDGVQSGVAILGHPANFRAPQPVRLHPSEPFFCFAPSQGGAWEISPGRPHVSRYRFITFDGPPDAAWLDRLWEDYAQPVETVK